jgi:hypothetical protein
MSKNVKTGMLIQEKSSDNLKLLQQSNNTFDLNISNMRDTTEKYQNHFESLKGLNDEMKGLKDKLDFCRNTVYKLNNLLSGTDEKIEEIKETASFVKRLKNTLNNLRETINKSDAYRGVSSKLSLVANNTDDSDDSLNGSASKDLQEVSDKLDVKNSRYQVDANNTDDSDDSLTDDSDDSLTDDSDNSLNDDDDVDSAKKGLQEVIDILDANSRYRVDANNTDDIIDSLTDDSDDSLNDESDDSIFKSIFEGYDKLRAIGEKHSRLQEQRNSLLNRLKV